MNIDKRMENHEFKMYWLSHASPDAVFEWLRNQDYKDSYHQEEIEKSLIVRNEPLINLGLALWGYDVKTGAHLFENGDRTIKKAVMSGHSIRHQMDDDNYLVGQDKQWAGVLKRLLESFDENLDLLASYLSNEYIDDSLLVALFERRAPFNGLTDEQWFKAICRTTGNPRLNAPYDGSLDIPKDLRYHSVFTSAWRLFETLPVTSQIAMILSDFGENLLPEKPHDMAVFATIKRWESVESDIDIDWYSARCRYLLARLIGDYTSEFNSLKNSEDIALRQSYYARFRPDKPDEVRKLFEKDKGKFLEEALENPRLYAKEAVREELQKCCFDYYEEHPSDLLGYPDTFNKRAGQFRQEHPEWFPDYNGRLPIDGVKNPVLRTDKRVKNLENKIEIIYQRLIGSEFQNQPSLIDEMKLILSESNQWLSERLSSKTTQTKAMGWGGLIIGVLTGFILAKWLL